MRTAFFILVLIHGLIHLLGFVKGFNISEVKQLLQPISKPMGIVWLFSCLLFIITAVLFVSKSSHWWLFGFVAVLISQILIIYFWQDAKFGTIVNILIIITVVIGYSSWHFVNTYQKDVKESLSTSPASTQQLITAEHITGLPEPVKKYLYYTGSIGKPRVEHFEIAFSGMLRKNDQSAWMPFTSEQHNFLIRPTRLFFLNAIMKHLPVAGYHRYKEGKAFMDIRLFSLFRVQYQDGELMDKAETLTFFNDMCCMAPPTLIDERIVWEEVDGNNVRASFTNNDITVSAWLYFNEQGELINFKSNDRYNHDAGKVLPWSTPLKDYIDFNGYKLASSAEAIYSYPEGDQCYGTFQLDHIIYH